MDTYTDIYEETDFQTEDADLAQMLNDLENGIVFN